MRGLSKKRSHFEDGDDYSSLIYEAMAYQIAPVMVYPGEDEMEALNLSGFRSIKAKE